MLFVYVFVRMLVYAYVSCPYMIISTVRQFPEGIKAQLLDDADASVAFQEYLGNVSLFLEYFS